VKGPRFQPPVIAFAHDPLHVLACDLQIIQKRAFERIAAVRILGRLPDPLQGQADVAVSNRLPERIGPPEVSMGKLFDFANAQFPAAQGHHKILDLLLLDSVCYAAQ